MIKNAKDEIWKPIKGYEGLYEISNQGRVKSLKRNTARTKILKLHDTKRYLQIELSKNGITEYKSVHRLVAEAFVPNPNNLPEVNHKDENKKNNFVGNLEWISRHDNLLYGTRIKRISEKKRTAVNAFDKNGNLIASYKSIKEAAEKNKLAPINISRCCREIYKSSGGLIWRFAD